MMNTQQQQLIEDNIKLAYWLAHKWAKSQSLIDTEELISISLFGLTMAAQSYKSDKNTQFNTYARLVIENRFKNELKKQKKYQIKYNESEETPDGKPKKPQASYTPEYDEAIDVQIALAALPEDYRLMIDEFYNLGYNQHEIAKRHNISQTKVSLMIKEAKYFIEQRIKMQFN